MAIGFTNANNVQTHTGSYVITPLPNKDIQLGKRTFYSYDITIQGDDNLIPENIQDGIIIAGVTGKALKIEDYAAIDGQIFLNNHLHYPYGFDFRSSIYPNLIQFSKYIIHVDSFEKVHYSLDDGETWIEKNTGINATSGNFKIKIVEGILDTSPNAKRWIGYSVGYSTLMYSDNGLDWIKININDFASNVQSLVFGMIGESKNIPMWCLLSTDGIVYTSIDGIVWSNKKVLLDMGSYYQYNNIVYYDGKFWIGNSTTWTAYQVYITSDGINWTEETGSYNPIGNVIGNPIYMNNESNRMYAIIEKTGTNPRDIKYTDDGRNWISTGFSDYFLYQEGNPNAQITFLKYENDVFYCGGTNLPFLYYGRLKTDNGVDWNVDQTESSCSDIIIINNSQNEKLYFLFAYDSLYINNQINMFSAKKTLTPFDVFNENAIIYQI